MHARASSYSGCTSVITRCLRRSMFPLGKVESLIQKVEAYLDRDTPTGKPKHQKLVEGISHIRLAILEAFWLDSPSLMPPPGVTVWWEVWLRVETTPDLRAHDAYNDILTSFRAQATRVGLTLGDARMILRFPERLVLLVHGTLEQMARSVELLASIAELRLARVRVEDFLTSDHQTKKRGCVTYQRAYVPSSAQRTGCLSTRYRCPQNPPTPRPWPACRRLPHLSS